jgi:hypothetical protein
MIQDKSKNPIKYPKVQIILLNDRESDNFGEAFKVINVRKTFKKLV